MTPRLPFSERAMLSSNPTAKKCHLKSAPHPLTKAEDSPIAISVLMKGIEISVVDAIPYYPVV